MHVASLVNVATGLVIVSLLKYMLSINIFHLQTRSFLCLICFRSDIFQYLLLVFGIFVYKPKVMIATNNRKFYIRI